MVKILVTLAIKPVRLVGDADLEVEVHHRIAGSPVLLLAVCILITVFQVLCGGISLGLRPLRGSV